MISKLNAVSHNLNRTPSAQLALIAGLSGFIYAAIFTFRFPLHLFYNTIPPVDYTKLTHYSPGGLFAYILGIGILFWLYVAAIRLTKPKNDQPSVVGGRFIGFSSAGLGLISVFSYPLTAIDLFVYAIRTRGWALYGLNPLAAAPENLPQTDPWLQLAAEWTDAASPYGPVWEILSLGGYYLSGGDYLAQLFALKVIAFLAYLGCVWLLYQTLQRLQPAWAVAGTLAFAWSPLVLLESIQNGHNDIVMIFFLLAAVWLWARWAKDQKKKCFDVRLMLACLLLAVSILVKFVTAAIVPFFLIGIALACGSWWRRGIAFLSYSILMASIVALGMWPLWPGPQQWAVLNTGSSAGRSLLALTVLLLRRPLGTNLAFDLAGNFILALLAIIYLYSLIKVGGGVRLHRMRAASPPLPRNLPYFYLPLWAIFFTLFGYVLLAAPVFHAWYLLWFIPPGILLLPYRRPLIAGTVFSLTALLVIPYFETIRVWYPALLQNQLLGHLIGVPFLILPPAIAIFWPISPPANSEV